MKSDPQPSSDNCSKCKSPCIWVKATVKYEVAARGLNIFQRQKSNNVPIKIVDIVCSDDFINKISIHVQDEKSNYTIYQGSMLVKVILCDFTLRSIIIFQELFERMKQWFTHFEHTNRELDKT